MRLRRTAFALALLLPLAATAELWAALTLLTATSTLSVAEAVAVLGLHLFSAVGLAEAMRLRYRPGSAASWGGWRLGLSLALALPVIGPLIVVVLALRPVSPGAGAQAGFISPMEHRARQAEVERAADADQEVADLSVEALRDVLKDEDHSKRLGAVGALREMESRAAVDLLIQTLDNTVVEVRSHAVEALARLNKKFSVRVTEATRALKEEPSPDNHRLLGEVYHEFAALGMEDPAIQTHLHRMSVAHLRRAVPSDAPASVELLVMLAQGLEQLGVLDEALQIFTDVATKDGNHMPALLGLARVQFLQANFVELCQTCQRIAEADALLEDEEAVAAVTYWANLSRAGAGRRR